MEIREFTKQNVDVVCNVVRTILQDAFAIGMPGVKVSLGSGSYSANHFELRVNFSLVKGGTVMTREADDLIANAKWLGLPENPIGLEFESGGLRYRLTGWKSKNRSYPVMAVGVADGKRYKFAKEVLWQLREKPIVVSPLQTTP